MVVSRPREAVVNAHRFTTCVPGKCLAYSRTWLDIDPLYGTAREAWDNAKHRHHGERRPPVGSPVFWAGGSEGFGHIALNIGNGMIRSTDVFHAGDVSDVPLRWVEDNWGMTFLGSTDDLNDVDIPYLMGDSGNSDLASGNVYVNRLHRGQHDSDSVARLAYRLARHRSMPKTHIPRPTRNYGEDLLEAVRYWQRNIAPQINGPTNGTSMSNPQANNLFGRTYNVIEEK